MNFFDSIMMGLKSLLGMPHDATEAEVDAKLQTLKTREELTAEIRAEIMADRSGDEEFLKLQGDLTALQTTHADTTKALETLQATHTALETSAAGLKQQVTDLTAEVAELKKKAAAAHTGGEPPEGGGKTQKAYDECPITQKARARNKA
jgi:chromosome segregation ATPase